MEADSRDHKVPGPPTKRPYETDRSRKNPANRPDKKFSKYGKKRGHSRTAATTTNTGHASHPTRVRLGPKLLSRGGNVSKHNEQHDRRRQRASLTPPGPTRQKEITPRPQTNIATVENQDGARKLNWAEITKMTRPDVKKAVPTQPQDKIAK